MQGFSVLSALIAGGVLSAATAPQTFHRGLVFEPNQGQAPAGFRWLGQSSGYQVLLDEESATIVIPDKTGLPAAAGGLPENRPPVRLKHSAIRMKLAGSRSWTDISGDEPTGCVSNYLNRHDVHRSVNQVPQYGRVRVAEVYPGIDLLLYTSGGDLEYDFAVSPGANPEQIQVVFEGTKQLRVDAGTGDLVLTLPGGPELRQLKPKVYQQIGQKRVEIAGGYRLTASGRAAFRLAGYDRKRPLVIDPRLTIARSFGGNLDDQANAIAVDENGNSYITGFTFSLNFPVTNNSVYLHPNHCGIDFCGSNVESNAFIAKVTSDGSIGFVTFAGVAVGNGIAVDSSGIYVTGEAVPPDADITTFPFANNAGDLYVQRLTPAGETIYFTLAGGPGEGFGIDRDFGNGIALDDLHNAWAVGGTFRHDGDITSDVLLVKIAPDGSKLVQRLISSSGNDVGSAIAVAARQPWLTGRACGDGFPTTDGIAHHLIHCAVFVAHQDEAGNRLLNMVFGGDDGDDSGTGIITNGSNGAIVTGYTNTVNFPRTTLGLLTAFRYSLPLGFITEVTGIGASPGTIVRSATINATDGFVHPYAIAVDQKNEIYISGASNSPAFPRATSPGRPGLSGFVMKVSPDITQIRYSVLLGETLSGIATRKNAPVFPEIYVTGWDDAVFHDPNSSRDAFMVKMLDETPTSFVTNATIEVNSRTFTVNWGGSSPVASAVTFDVFVSDNGGPFTPFQTGTTAMSATFTGEPGHSYGFFSIATDAGGSKEPMKAKPDAVVTIGDVTPPAIIPQITGTAGSNGWYRSGVTVNWNVSDPESGMGSSTGCASTNLTSETAGVTLTCSATNGAGLSASVPVTIKIDKTAPAISGMPAAGCSLWPPNHKLAQVATVTAADALSGLAPGSLRVSATSNEPSADPKDPQIVITPTASGGFTVQLQAERSGGGRGRVYTISATAMDTAGNPATATATCVVPHDNGAK